MGMVSSVRYSSSPAISTMCFNALPLDGSKTSRSAAGAIESQKIIKSSRESQMERSIGVRFLQFCCDEIRKGRWDERTKECLCISEMVINRASRSYLRGSPVVGTETLRQASKAFAELTLFPVPLLAINKHTQSTKGCLNDRNKDKTW